MFKTVLFPFNPSREAAEAAKVATNIVQTYNSRLVVLSVVQSPSDEEEQTETSLMNSAQAVEELLNKAKTLFSAQGINVETIEREGLPSFTICDVADEIDADLIIMGSKGTGLTDEGASESITNRVINLSPCPVLVVP